MTSAKPIFNRKRLLKSLLVVAGVFILLVGGLHIWFVKNAKSVLKQMVETKSHGKLKLELSELTFDFLTNELKVSKADISSTDSITRPNTYHGKFNTLTLKIGSFWPLLFNKKLTVDSIKLHNPEIEVLQWRKDTAFTAKEELSIPQEMGKIYNSMLDGLEVFGIRRIMVNNARISLINKMKPGSEPVTVSNIYFDLVRTASKVGKRDEFVEAAQTVDLRTVNQNIALPGGRHRLSFKKFNLRLFKKRIEIDSCTITATGKSGSRSGYNIFFKKLLLVGVDFDAMYRQNLIKADSVYCENPLFDIHLERGTTASQKTARPDPEKIIRELTGDLDLAFIGVRDAGIRIDIIGRKKRSFFNSNKDNFEMRGLRINSHSSKPVNVERFDMLVRDYHLYNEDSSIAYTFDSIHFVNRKIVLNNFTALTTADQDSRRNKKNFKIPYFELTGLDWYELIFDQNLRAEQAVLLNPVIDYVQTTIGRRRKKTTLFSSFQSLDSLMTLDKMTIINGNARLKLPAASFNLERVNLSLYSDRLLKATNKEGMRRAVDHFSFSKGVVKLKDITAQLHNARYTGSNLIRADKISVISSGDKIKASIDDVYIDNLLLNEAAESLVVDGLRWKTATIALKPSAVANAKSKRGSGGNINFKNIAGNNTTFTFSKGKTAISTFVQSLKVSSLTKSTKDPVHIEGLALAGSNLLVNNGPLKVEAASYHLASDATSYLSRLNIESIQNRDSTIIQLPRVDFSADINAILADNINLSNVHLQSPVVKVTKWSIDTTIKNQNKSNGSIIIDRITAMEPSINISTHRNDSVTVINIPRSENSEVKAADLKMNSEGFQLGSISLNTTAATYVNKSGETLGVEKGKVDVALSDIRVQQKDGKPLWSVIINALDLENPNSLAVGKNRNKLVFKHTSVGNLNLSSAYVADFSQLLKFNVSAWLRSTTGQYVDSNTTLKWFNADYDYRNRTLSLDSFIYYPTRPKDSVIANTPYQTDYITFHSGPIKFIDFDLEKYKKDGSLIANTINVTNPVISIYRDKFPPFQGGVVKPLPVNMIKNISLPVSIEKVNLIDGTLSYTERNAKTRAEGALFLKRLNGGLANIKNRDLLDNDSLLFTLNAYLMDSALLNLRVKESYADPLSGFLMTLRMQPTTLSFLNPVLAPMSNVKFTSGTIDSFHLRAIGKENLSLGEMQMYYHDLRIKLVKDGEQENTSFLSNVASFLVNALLIKKNNNGRTGLVYFERLRERSFFNYIVKMTFSGMTTSIGVKKNRKYMKEYRRELQERNLPPIVFE